MPSSSTLRVGTALTDITPSAGEHLSGDVSRHRPAHVAIDRLFARAAIFEAGGKRLCVISMDITIVTEEGVAVIRRGIAERTGISPDAIMVHGTQTHSAPSLGEFIFDKDVPVEIGPEFQFVCGTTRSYSQMACERAIDAAVRALDRMRPVNMAVGAGRRMDVGYNRRMITNGGQAAMPFPGHSADYNATFRYPEFPHDPEVGVLALRDDQLHLTAALLHFTTHPVNLYCSPGTFNAVSSDWCGAWCDGVRAATGEDMMPMVINGCCGDSNPWDPFDRFAKFDHRRQGNDLTCTTNEIIAKLKFSEVDRLDWRIERVPLDYREVPAERQAAVEKMLKEHPSPALEGDPPRVRLDWVMAASTASIAVARKRSPQLMYEIHVLRIGDAAIVGLPGEPFSITQMKIKMASPAKLTLVAHNVGQYAGYVPPAESYLHGGHEANAECTSWAKLAPGCAEKVEAAAVRMLRDVFAT